MPIVQTATANNIVNQDFINKFKAELEKYQSSLSLVWNSAGGYAAAIDEMLVLPDNISYHDSLSEKFESVLKIAPWADVLQVIKDNFIPNTITKDESEYQLSILHAVDNYLQKVITETNSIFKNSVNDSIKNIAGEFGFDKNNLPTNLSELIKYYPDAIKNGNYNPAALIIFDTINSNIAKISNGIYDAADKTEFENLVNKEYQYISQLNSSKNVTFVNNVIDKAVMDLSGKLVSLKSSGTIDKSLVENIEAKKEMELEDVEKILVNSKSIIEKFLGNPPKGFINITSDHNEHYFDFTINWNYAGVVHKLFESKNHLQIVEDAPSLEMAKRTIEGSGITNQVLHDVNIDELIKLSPKIDYEDLLKSINGKGDILVGSMTSNSVTSNRVSKTYIDKLWNQFGYAGSVSQSIQNGLNDSQYSKKKNDIKANIKLKVVIANNSIKLRPYIVLEDVVPNSQGLSGSVKIEFKAEPNVITPLDAEINLINNSSLEVHEQDIDKSLSGFNDIGNSYVSERWPNLVKKLRPGYTFHFNPSTNQLKVDLSKQDIPNDLLRHLISSVTISPTITSLEENVKKVEGFLSSFKSKPEIGNPFSTQEYIDNPNRLLTLTELNDAITSNTNEFIDAVAEFKARDDLKDITWSPIKITDQKNNLTGLDFSLEFAGPNMFDEKKNWTYSVNKTITLQDESSLTKDKIESNKNEINEVAEDLKKQVEESKYLSEYEKKYLFDKINEINNEYAQRVNEGITISDSDSLIKSVISEMNNFIKSFVDAINIKPIIDKVNEIFNNKLPEGLLDLIKNDPDLVKNILKNFDEKDVKKILFRPKELSNLKSTPMNVIDSISKIYSKEKYAYFGIGVASGLIGLTTCAAAISITRASRNIKKIKSSQSNFKGIKLISLITSIVSISTIITSIVLLLWFFINEGGFNA